MAKEPKAVKEKVYFRYAWSMDKFMEYKNRLSFDYFNSDEFCEAWDEFLLYRSVIKLPLTEYGAYSNLLELHKISQGDIAKAIASIRQTIGSGKWQTFYEPKTYVKQYIAPQL